MFNFGIKRAKGKCQRLQRTNTSSYGLSPIIDHVTPLQWIIITEDEVYANTILTYKYLVGALVFGTYYSTFIIAAWCLGLVQYYVYMELFYIIGLDAL